MIKKLIVKSIYLEKLNLLIKEGYTICGIGAAAKI